MKTVTDAKNFLMNLETIPFTRHDAPVEVIEKLNLAMKILRESPLWYSLDDLPHEIWREIAGYDGDYLASIFGRIKSMKQKKRRILRQSIGVRGYLLICLCKNNKVKNARVHRLVAETFLANAQNKAEVNHFYGVAANAVWQIEWVTGVENMAHAVQIGLQKSGADVYNAKLTSEQAAEVLRLYVKGSKEFGSVALGKRFGTTHNQILRIVHGKTYKSVLGERSKAQIRKSAKFLTEEEKNSIRHMYQKNVIGHGAPTLAKIFDVDTKTILKIVKEVVPND